MKTFLQLAAHDIYKKFGNNLAQIAIIFPNKRASLFFNEYLAKESNEPIWAPSYHSISELIQSLSNLQLADNIQLIALLYEIFIKHTQSKETLDEFFFWGELLLSDFDDIDKNLVDAEQLLLNLKELKELSNTEDFLEEEQLHALKVFFKNFKVDSETKLKTKFNSIWNQLYKIYTSFKEELKNQNIAYEGMLYRHNIEHLNTANLKYKQYIFIGFNVLNQVEKSFFMKLLEADKAKFYWDYDLFYLKNKSSYHEAGEFIKRNLKLFPNELDESHFNTLGKPKNISFISSATETAQARILPDWISTYLDPKKEKENAVVLCNEALLLPVLHSIPSSVNNLNITMGFPLSQTPIFSLLKALMELQNKGYNDKQGYYTYQAVLSVLKHPYTRKLSDKARSLEEDIINYNKFYLTPSELKQDHFLSLLFEPQTDILKFSDYLLQVIEFSTPIYKKEKDDDDVFDQLYRESLFKSYTLINRVHELIDGDKLPIKKHTLQYLLENILSSAKIPFHGEPAIGMQIMGVLETRNLDFKNLIMMSVNEGQLPKKASEASFIPYNLRKAFGMTTIEHQNAVYAYYFYRLIQRAENITLLYNTASDGLNKGEISRFMLQLLIEYKHQIDRKYLQSDHALTHSQKISFKKSPEVFKILRDSYDISREMNENKIVSPSALNTYLDCQLKFYFKYIVKLKSPNEVSEEIDPAKFGSIFHKAAEKIYLHMSKNSNEITKSDIQTILNAKGPHSIESFVDLAFKQLFFNIKMNESAQYNGIQLINKKVICTYIKQLLENDLNYTPFKLIATEETVKQEVKIQRDNEEYSINIGGNIDRIDLKKESTGINTLRVVDYKTGGSEASFNEISELFTPSEKRPNYILQAFIYCHILNKPTTYLKFSKNNQKQTYQIAPALLYIHRAATNDKTYSPIIQMGSGKNKTEIINFDTLEEEFDKYLKSIISEIFEQEGSFEQTEHTRTCEYCDFKNICKQ